ncbi:hypothetical protein Pmar_PMAR011368, partial [Perkinsus marinus ATCC 50983]
MSWLMLAAAIVSLLITQTVVMREYTLLNESLAAANRELSAFLAGRGFQSDGEDLQALRGAVEDQHNTNAQLERELEQVRGMLEDETE